MKKVLFLFVTLFIGQTAFAYNFSAVAPTGQTLYYRLRVGGVGVCYPGSSTSTSSSPWSGYTTPSGALTIPTSVTHNGVTYSVTAIEDYAFSGCSGLISACPSASLVFSPMLPEHIHAGPAGAQAVRMC